MSRTDKHRPYWVKVNDQGVEHHDHSRFGEEVWRTRRLFDADRKPIIEVVTTYAEAADYVRSRRVDSIGYPTTSYRERNADGSRVWFYGHTGVVSVRKLGPTLSEAQLAVNRGEHRRLIPVGTHRQQKTERYLAYTVADYCTINETHDQFGQAPGWRGTLPCYKEADWATDRSTYMCSCTWCNPGVDYGSLRRDKREMLGKAKRHYNSGDENWFDCMDGDDITPSRKTYRAW